MRTQRCCASVDSGIVFDEATVIVTLGRGQASGGNTEAETSQPSQHSRINFGLPTRPEASSSPRLDSEHYLFGFDFCYKLLPSRGAVRMNSCRIFGSLGEAPGNSRP